MLDLRLIFFGLLFFTLAFSVDARKDELILRIDNYFSYISSSVTFSVNIGEIPKGDLAFPEKYVQGYNELGLLGDNFLLAKKVPFYLDIKILVPVVNEPIKKGKVITSQDVLMGWKPIKDYSNGIILDINKLIGKESVFYKKSGNIFYNRDVKVVDIIKMQDECMINANSGSVHISMPGVSLKNGSLGSTIKVLNKQTGRILDARVVGSKNVEVIIN